MAEAPNFILLLTLTSMLDSLSSYFLVCKIWTMMTFFIWVRDKWNTISQQTARGAKSMCTICRQRGSIARKLQYHCFKQHMKHKLTYKGQFIKPKPLFYLTWKFKAIKLILHVAIFIYLANGCVEHLVSDSFQLLLLLCQL
jgi:hypothetical protein